MRFFNWFKKKKDVEVKEEVKEMVRLSADEIIKDFVNGKYPSREIGFDRFTLNICLSENVEIITGEDTNNFKKIYPDVLIMKSKFPKYEYVDMWFRVGPRCWMSFDTKSTFDGMNKVIDYFNFNTRQWLTHEKNESDELQNIRVYALSIGTVIERENIKLNEYFLNDEKFLELKEKNFFGINEVHVKPFGSFMMEYKLLSHFDYIFRKDLFDPCFKHTFGKKELGFEMEELLEKFYISRIYYVDVDAKGNVIKNVIENENKAIEAYDIIKNELVPKLDENKIKLL